MYVAGRVAVFEMAFLVAFIFSCRDVVWVLSVLVFCVWVVVLFRVNVECYVAVIRVRKT